MTVLRVKILNKLQYELYEIKTALTCCKNIKFVSRNSRCGKLESRGKFSFFVAFNVVVVVVAPVQL